MYISCPEPNVGPYVEWQKIELLSLVLDMYFVAGIL